MRIRFKVDEAQPVTQISSALVFCDGVKHERHSSSETAEAMIGKSGDPFPSTDIN